MKKADTVTLSYETSCNTIAGTIQFDNMAELKKTKQGYKLVWQDSLIFPDLESDDKISVTTSKAERGEILDRDGKMLAGKGVATSVGIIPGKLEDRNVSIEKIAELLEIDVETINNKLTAKWVKEDSFVPIETIPKVEEIDLMKIQPEEKTLEEQDCQNKLLEIPGVMLSDVEVRTYELGEAAAHLIGYVQSATAEDLENHPGEGYSAESVIGRSGVEKLYEKQLKGKDGCDIKILDSEGEVKEVLASIFKEDGMDIRLTIDSDLQKSLYEQFKEDPGCSVAMNPYTGEVLALVSTPSYDNNEFIRGLSSEKWTSLNEDEKTIIRGTFGPSAAVWTFFMFLYFIFSIIFMVFITIWFVTKQINSQDFPWAIYLSIFALVLLLLTFLATKIGQKKAKTEMEKLKNFAENSILK
jgi:penicillin-binding protein